MRTRGVGEVVALGAARIRETLSSEETLVILVRATPGEAGAGRGLALRALAEGDGRLYARAIGTDSASTFRARLAPDTRCFVVEDGERVLHASWVTTGCAWTRELRSYICGGPGDAYVYESFTRSDARGRGVYPFALKEICRVLDAEQVGRLWVAVEAHNEPSLKAVTKAGFEQELTIQYARRLGRLSVNVPVGVKTDTSVAGRRKKARIWLSRDGAMQQWER